MSVQDFFRKELPKLLKKNEEAIFKSLQGEVFRFDIAGAGSWIVSAQKLPISIYEVSAERKYAGVSCTFQADANVFMDVYREPSVKKLLMYYMRGKIRVSDKAKVAKLRLLFA